MNKKHIREAVRNTYGEIARIAGNHNSGTSSAAAVSCCSTGSSGSDTMEDQSSTMKYSQVDLESLPEGADLALGCGNPIGFSQIKEGHTVLDLGAGGGIDCFLASKKVGPQGRVIGVDMTPDMVERARKNGEKGGYTNVEFRLGEIEHLPVADASVDLIVSNCVINLSVDKSQVFGEAYRVLKPGGKMVISDIVLTKNLPGAILESVGMYTACIAGALIKEAYLSEIAAARMRNIKILSEKSFAIDALEKDPMVQSIKKEHGISEQEAAEIASGVVSITVYAEKPQ